MCACAQFSFIVKYDVSLCMVGDIHTREMGREREGVGLARRGDQEMTAVADDIGALLSTEDTPILHSPILHTGTATTLQY